MEELFLLIALAIFLIVFSILIAKPSIVVLITLTLVVIVTSLYNPALSLPDVIYVSVITLYAISVVLIINFIRFAGVYRFYSSLGIFFATIALIALSIFVILVGRLVNGILGLLGIIVLLIFLIVPYVALLRFSECDARGTNNFS
ncbi:MAG: hypothetical protein PHY30_03340 [Candidatus Pacebacteria bacterium]|nr:hypothetical protein [Candidatus Paceibacterota bacterium]